MKKYCKFEKEYCYFAQILSKHDRLKQTIIDKQVVEAILEHKCAKCNGTPPDNDTQKHFDEERNHGPIAPDNTPTGKNQRRPKKERENV